MTARSEDRGVQVEARTLLTAAVGTVVESGHGNRWRKRSDGLWDVLTDPAWGPAMLSDLPRLVTLTDGGAR